MQHAKKPDRPDVYAEPVEGILELTIAANRIAGGPDSTENPYALRNELILREQKQKIRYKNGYTLPASVIALENDALRRAKHSRTLRRNLKQANPSDTRHPQADTHHVVARLDVRAEDSRKYLFNWGIGINDADNGVFLPRNSHSRITSMPNALDHRSIHTRVYHLEVFRRLWEVSQKSTLIGREVLRRIKRDLLAGTFPY